MNQSENTSPKSEQKVARPVRAHASGETSPEKPLGRDGVKIGNRWVYPLSTKSRTGVSWVCMMNRCYNRNVACFKSYGGVGVHVCEGLRRGPHAIRDIIGLRPTDKSIDRIQTDASYTCGTCSDCVNGGHRLNIRWATPREQRMNQKRTELVVINGVEKSYEEWATIAGLSWHTFYGRVKAYKWTGTKLLTRPGSGAKKRLIAIGSQTKSLSEWANIAGVSPSVIWSRLKRGWKPDQLLTPPLKCHQRINELEETIKTVVARLAP